MSKQLAMAVFGLALVSGSVSEVEASTKTFTFKIGPRNMAEYETFLGGRNPLEINNFEGEGLLRHVLELVLFQRAMHEAPCECVVEYEARSELHTHIRAIADVRAGRVVAHPVAGFSNDPRYTEGVWLSEPILAKNDFHVGLYTHASRQSILSIEDPEQVRNLKFTVGRSWVVDNKVIDTFGFAKLPADNWVGALKMLRAGRADVIMQPFVATPDFSFTDAESGERFLPIQGIKLLFGAARQYFVSKKHPDGAFFLENLNAGIKKMQTSGLTERANIAAGLLNPRTRNWALIK